MRIALISDIHGNDIALETVLADISREQIDQLICLGDVASLGPRPREVIARLKTLSCSCIMGNHDFHLLNPAVIDKLPSWEAELTEWCIGQLLPPDLDYLESFQPLLEISLDDQATLLCFHGSPRSNNEGILPTAQPAELDEMLAGHTATVMAQGHTHHQMLRQYRGLVLVNAGSVGRPFEMPWPPNSGPCLLPWAEYAIINWVDRALNVELRHIPIDLEAVKRAVLSSGMPGAEGFALELVRLAKINAS